MAPRPRPPSNRSNAIDGSASAAWALALGLAVGSLASSPPAAGQPASRIGVIANGSPTASAPAVNAFRERMRELGYVEGRNLVLDVRFADELRHAGALPQRYRELVDEVLGHRADVIVTPNTVGTRAAKAATSTVPIVMVGVGNAVGAGLVKSLARPGGNVTGQSFMGAELNLKELDLLVDVLPRARRIVALFNPDLATEPTGPRALGAAARAKGISLHYVPIRPPDTPDLAAMGPGRPDALLVFAVTETQQARIVDFAARHRLPAVYGFREAVDAGGLMSFGPRLPDLWRGAAHYVDRIRRGASPGELPVEQPARFELVVNQRTAKALGVVIPAAVLARADEVIE
jgi:putative ABC transport system substrate-binding protein